MLQKKRQKVELQIELLKVQIYKKKLESLKLEKEMGLERSEITKNIAESQGKEQNSAENVYYILENSE